MAQPFRIDIPEAELDDLRRRIAATRWPDEVDGAGWDYGTNLDYLRGLADYWLTKFDWREQECRLNELPQFTADVDGQLLHFVRVRGQGPNPMPLLITHGWPSTFWEMYKLIPLLADPASHGGDPADAFDVVAPSMPGYGFSAKPTSPGMSYRRVADLFTRLMTDELGYARFGAHGGDWGGAVTSSVAQAHPNEVIGAHVTLVIGRRTSARAPIRSRMAKGPFSRSATSGAAKRAATATYKARSSRRWLSAWRTLPSVWRGGSWRSSGRGATAAGTSRASTPETSC